MRTYFIENCHISWHVKGRITGTVIFGSGAVILPTYYERNVHRKRYTRADAEAVVEWLNKREARAPGLMVPGCQAGALYLTDQHIFGPGEAISWLDLEECRDTAE